MDQVLIPVEHHASILPSMKWSQGNSETSIDSPLKNA
jgi:hypothetical protein